MSTPTGPTGPGRDEEHGSHALTPIERMAQTIAADVAQLEDDAIAPLVPVLREARRELEAGLNEWLARADGAERYTAQAHRRGLAAIEDTITAIGRMRPEMQRTLLDAMGAGGELAAAHLREEFRRFGDAFGQSIGPTNISAAAIVRRAKHEIIPRIRSSSARYVNSVREDLRHQLAIGLVKGETFGQMTNRLRRLGGPRGIVAIRGVAGEPGAHVEDIAEGLFARYRHWADRVVRTEVIHAYNAEHAAGISEINANREDGEDALLFKWDSSTDKRSCAMCKALDRKTLAEGETFAKHGHQIVDGKEVERLVKHPPLHPSCRCVLVAWHPSWGEDEGEHSPPQQQKSGREEAHAVPLPSAKKRAGGKAPKQPSKQEQQRDAAIKEMSGRKVQNARPIIDDMLTERGLEKHANVGVGSRSEIGRLPRGIGGVHRNGDIVIRTDVAKGAQAFAKSWAHDPAKTQQHINDYIRERDAWAAGNGLKPSEKSKGARLYRQADSYRTLLHETLHGYGAEGNYKGPQRIAEEVSTEVMARKLMREQFGIELRGIVSKADGQLKDDGSYGKWIHATEKAIMDATGLDASGARKVLDGAAEHNKRMQPPYSAPAHELFAESVAASLPKKLRGKVNASDVAAAFGHRWPQP